MDPFTGPHACYWLGRLRLEAAGRHKATRAKALPALPIDFPTRIRATTSLTSLLPTAPKIGEPFTMGLIQFLDVEGFPIARMYLPLYTEVIIRPRR